MFEVQQEAPHHERTCDFRGQNQHLSLQICECLNTPCDATIFGSGEGQQTSRAI